MERLNKIFVILFCIILQGCTRSDGSGNLCRSEVIGHILFKCSVNAEDLIKKTDKLKTLRFNFIISDDSRDQHKIKRLVGSHEEYSSYLAYANKFLQNDFELELENGDRIPCSLVHMEPANSIQPVIRIAICFPNVENDLSSYTFIFNDNFFNSGKIKFRFNNYLAEYQLTNS